MAVENNFAQTVTVGVSQEAVSQALIASVSGVSNCTLATVGTGSIIVTRKYRKAWPIIVVVVGLLLFFLISILLGLVIMIIGGLIAIFYKYTETFTATLAPEVNATRITISGVANGELMQRVGAALSAMPEVGSNLDPPLRADG